MRLLVLGGTSFVGRHIVEAALASGHEVTLFNRGQTNPDLFSQCDRRTGDRTTGDYSSLSEGEWDAVVDVNAYVPRNVAEVSDAVKGRATRLLFISTGSVYDLASGDGSEDAERVAAITDTEDVTNEAYGGLKVACEDVAADRWGDALTIVRPGIVAGPHDPTDRFTWWVRRCTIDDELLVAGRPNQPVQVIDGRDLGRFCVHLLAHDTPGRFDAVGPDQPATLESMWRRCRKALGRTPGGITYIDPGWLAKLGEPFPPLVVPAAYDVLFSRRNEAARAVGLDPRPLEDTARDTHEWDVERGTPPLRDGPDAAAEARIGGAWRAEDRP
jgi:2'-hydroxyisoflavone reductase